MKSSFTNLAPARKPIPFHFQYLLPYNHLSTIQIGSVERPPFTTNNINATPQRYLLISIILQHSLFSLNHTLSLRWGREELEFETSPPLSPKAHPSITKVLILRTCRLANIPNHSHTHIQQAAGSSRLDNALFVSSNSRNPTVIQRPIIYRHRPSSPTPQFHHQSLEKEGSNNHCLGWLEQTTRDFHCTKQPAKALFTR